MSSTRRTARTPLPLLSCASLVDVHCNPHLSAAVAAMHSPVLIYTRHPGLPPVDLAFHECQGVVVPKCDGGHLHLPRDVLMKVSRIFQGSASSPQASRKLTGNAWPWHWLEQAFTGRLFELTDLWSARKIVTGPILGCWTVRRS